ncbi:MAG: sensor histidine kinase [Cyclobacteriaceae bacterium]|nr:MAG: sensor histidine kinase [Cyclobacteriaceae bacterium]
MPVSNTLFKQRVLLLHISFWVLYLSYRVYDMQEYVGFQRAFIYAGLPAAFNLIASYTHYIFIFPILFRDKNWKKYVLLIIALLIPVFCIRIFVENEVYSQFAPNEAYFKTLKLSRIISTLWDTLTFIVFTGMIRFVLEWFELENKRKQLENEKLNAELNYLKSQINPHFLFNTLHSLNSLVYAGAKNANDVIIKLSNIMRYMIYESGKERVPLSSEIAYMNDYIHLESIRLNNSFKLDFKISGPVEQATIAPLMLITFLENAFKHGVSDREPDCWIEVRLLVDSSKVLYYHVANKKIQRANQPKLKSGFGLVNVKKRLELSYPKKHTLDVTDTETTYSIDLTLPLS